MKVYIYISGTNGSICINLFILLSPRLSRKVVGYDRTLRAMGAGQ